MFNIQNRYGAAARARKKSHNNFHLSPLNLFSMFHPCFSVFVVASSHQICVLWILSLNEQLFLPLRTSTSQGVRENCAPLIILISFSLPFVRLMLFAASLFPSHPSPISLRPTSPTFGISAKNFSSLPPASAAAASSPWQQPSATCYDTFRPVSRTTANFNLIAMRCDMRREHSLEILLVARENFQSFHRGEMCWAMHTHRKWQECVEIKVLFLFCVAKDFHVVSSSVSREHHE